MLSPLLFLLNINNITYVTAGLCVNLKFIEHFTPCVKDNDNDTSKTTNVVELKTRNLTRFTLELILFVLYLFILKRKIVCTCDFVTNIF